MCWSLFLDKNAGRQSWNLLKSDSNTGVLLWNSIVKLLKTPA